MSRWMHAPVRLVHALALISGAIMLQQAEAAGNNAFCMGQLPRYATPAEAYRVALARKQNSPDHGDASSDPDAMLQAPLRSMRTSSPFGQRVHPIRGDVRHHTGIDLAAPAGTPVLAAGEGVVLRVTADDNYGKYVVIRHAAGIETYYGHLSSVDSRVKVGNAVSAGERIGAVGSTGAATGPHLHFEVRHDGRPVDPMLMTAGLGLGAEILPVFPMRCREV